MRYCTSMRKKNTKGRSAEKLVELLQQAVGSEHVLVTCARQETEDRSGAEQRIPGMGEQTRSREKNPE